MPVNTALADSVWARYQYCRDNGHLDFVKKATTCDNFFKGLQWAQEDLAKLKDSRRPALTINKIISTLGTVMGEQIYQRSEIAYRPRSGAPAETAEALTKVFKQIADNNQLDWLRSDMFADGAITSRGFYDVRLDYTDSMQGEVRITKPNPKNVVIDPDGEEYDPDTWRDSFLTKWLTADDIAILYNKADADYLRMREPGASPYGFDSFQERDRFGSQPDQTAFSHAGADFSGVVRSIRVLERQYRKMDRQKHFVAPTTGDMRPVPEDWDRNKIAWYVENAGLLVVPKLVSRIRWTVVADNVVLHDEWSPFKHFTLVPYFPYFRHGTTIGLVENLLGSQELLNKTSSQELHIVNTTANSGYKVKAGALSNMTPEELEQRGAETGIVIEVNGDPEKDVQKIQPNQVPQGLDRISYKAEEHIKTISGVSDSMAGFDREDVAAKAIQQKRQAGNTNLAKPLDSLTRSDFILARNVLDLIQGYYTEERLLTITKNRVTGESEQFAINSPTAEGRIVNDLTLGEYDVVTSSVPQRETLEDSQFDQAVALRQLGVPIPDDVLIENSRLTKKADIIRRMRGDSESPEAQQQAELAQRMQAAELAKVEGEAAQKSADAQLKTAKAQKELQPEQEQGADPSQMLRVEGDLALQRERLEHDKEIDWAELELKRQDQAQKAEDARMAAAAEAVKTATSTQEDD